jgi:hypothetical protein
MPQNLAGEHPPIIPSIREGFFTIPGWTIRRRIASCAMEMI